MKNLFIVDGAAGTGKTDLLDYVRSKYSPGNVATALQKFTTRGRRPEEIDRDLPLDLEFLSSQEFEERSVAPDAYTYEYGGHRYGFTRRSINTALSNYASVFVIVRDLVTIQRLMDDYRHVRCVPVYIYSDRGQIIKRLKRDAYGKDAIQFRLDRTTLVWHDYLRHPGLYREILINNSIKNDFNRLIDLLLSKYASAPPDVLAVSPHETYQLPLPLVGFRDRIMCQLKKFPYERNVFLMMKFRESNKLVYEFIATQLTKKNLVCVRADADVWNLTNDIYNPLSVLHCCKYGIALFDEPEEGNTFSPNVAYELGMMHLQRKRCLILRHSLLPAMPFDLIKDLDHVYSKDLELEAIVNRWIHDLPAER